jgi:tetratricopeptide (TPR) repeat protein
MWHHNRRLGVVAVLALFGAYLFLPRDEERAAMLARDGFYESALREVATLPHAGSRRAEVLLQLHALQRKEGSYLEAIDSIQKYLLLRPHDFVARENLAELLLQTGQIEPYLVVSRRLVSMRPDAERVARLAGLYRLHGFFEKEFELLEDLSKTEHLGHQELQRLGAMLAERGKWSAAVRSLTLADRKAPANLNHGRLLLLDVLLQIGDKAEALQKSKSWMSTWRDPYLAAKLILVHSAAGDTESAITLAELSADLMPNAAFDIVGVLTRGSAPELGRHLLVYWSDRVRDPGRDQWRDYVYAVLQIGDVAAPFRMLSALTQSSAKPASRAVLAEEIANAMGLSAFGSFRELLTTDVLQTRPLFGAHLALHEGNSQLSQRYLDTVNLEDLSGEHKQLWLQLLGKVESRAAIFRRLYRLWSANQLPTEYRRELAKMALQENELQIYNAIWSSLAN